MGLKGCSVEGCYDVGFLNLNRKGLGPRIQGSGSCGPQTLMAATASPQRRPTHPNLLVGNFWGSSQLLSKLRQGGLYVKVGYIRG